MNKNIWEKHYTSILNYPQNLFMDDDRCTQVTPWCVFKIKIQQHNLKLKNTRKKIPSVINSIRILGKI